MNESASPLLPFRDPFPEPVLVEPPGCACAGGAPQMREHTARWCSVFTTAEINELVGDCVNKILGDAEAEDELEDDDPAARYANDQGLAPRPGE